MSVAQEGSLVQGVQNWGNTITHDVPVAGAGRLVVTAFIANDDYPGEIAMTTTSINMIPVMVSDIPDSPGRKVMVYMGYSTDSTTQTIALSWRTNCEALIETLVFTGAKNPIGLYSGRDYSTGANTGSSATPSVSITTVGAESYIYSCGIIARGLGTFTPDAGTTTIDFYRNFTDWPSGQGVYKWLGKGTNLVGPGSYTISGTNDVSNAWNWVAVEILSDASPVLMGYDT